MDRRVRRVRVGHRICVKVANNPRAILRAKEDEMGELDETFLQECLSELRDGETVTLRVGVRFRQKVRDALVKLGATREELDRLVIE